jgi:PAS domain S-box-containing protein
MYDVPSMESGKASENRGWSEFIVESAPCALLLVDANLQIRLVNRRAEVLLGYPRIDMLDHPIDQLIPGPLRRRIQDLISRLYVDPNDSEIVQGLELAVRRRDNSEISLSITIRMLMTANEPMALLSATPS